VASALLPGCTSLRETPPTDPRDSSVTADIGSDTDIPLADSAITSDGGDAAPADASIRDPGLPRRVFVTSDVYTPLFADRSDRNIDIVLGRVDALCDAAAVRAGLGGRYRAWIGGRYLTVRRTPAEHANAIRGPYLDVLGNTIFTVSTVPASGAPTAPSVTELGTRLTNSDRVWTGDGLNACEANVDGSPMGWTSTTNFAECGNPVNPGFWYGGFTAACSEKLHLYCFER
jgi:hypothetical protein